ncbi:hypothetical protein [Paenibacillus etheri]|uniref:hypothetical protein n=1 Tax=Paenibacillus etheri TaxID=1306852 RepID=UPI001ADF627D|nr:hypothetical protein [Paenibacillus etheri]
MTVIDHFCSFMILTAFSSSVKRFNIKNDTPTDVITGINSAFLKGETAPLENYIPIAYLIAGV